MIKKSLFATVVISIVLSSIASAFVAPVQSSNIKSEDASTLTSTSTAVTWLLLAATKDTYIEQYSPNTNYGGGDCLIVGDEPIWTPNRREVSLLEFDLSSLPTDAVITSAKLSLYYYAGTYNSPWNGNNTICVNKLFHTDWVELESTWNAYAAGKIWETPGGDWDGPYAWEILTDTHGWVTWDVLALVQDAQSLGTPAEMQLRYIANTVGARFTDFWFYSRECPDPYLRPKLVLEYTTTTTPPTSTPTPIPTATPWSFAIITDTHIGLSECQDGGDYDFGATGWDDNYDYSSSNSEGALVNLKTSVAFLNDKIDPLSGGNPDNIKFVVILGDLTHNAELSELQAVKDVLSELRVPWLPLPGSHDVWPYTGTCWATGSHCWGTEFVAPQAGGEGPDWYFNDKFYSDYQNFSDDLGLPSTWKEAVPNLNQETSPKYKSYFQNMAFDYGGFHFVVTDFNDRHDASNNFKGTTGEPNLWDFEGGTWYWFKQHLTTYLSNSDNQAQGKNIIILSHNPFAAPFPADQWHYVNWDVDETTKISHFLITYKENLNIQFSGHLHPGESFGERGPMDATLVYHNYFTHKAVMSCITIPNNGPAPWVQIVKLNPSDKSVNYDKDLFHAITYETDCPVNLIINDPDNLVISKDINQIPGAFYSEYDRNGDGSPDDLVWIPDRKPGKYSIQVIPESSANVSDTFTLTASPTEDRWGETPIVLAQNVTISNIPTEPYTFEVKQRTATNLSYTGSLCSYNFDTINLTAALSTDNGNPLSGKTINFLVRNQSASAMTDANGVAAVSLTLSQNESGLSYVEYGFAGDTDYLPYYDTQFFVIPPVADAAGPYTGTEGSPIALNGSGTYDPEGKVISNEWDLDNDGAYDDATGGTPAYTWNDDHSGSIGLRVTDASGTISIATTTITINNVPPTVEAGPNISGVLIASPVSFNGSFTDPGTLDTHTIVWDFGDGTPVVTGTLTPTHTYTSSGNYTVILTVTDDDGVVGTDTLTINVISPTPSITTYTFASGGGTNKWCSTGHIHLIDWNNGHPHSPSDFSASPTYDFISGGSTEYTQISSSNNVRWKSSISHDLGCCAFDRNAELFIFKIAENASTITNIQIKWKGHGTTGETIYYNTEKLWKYSNSTWTQLRNQKNVTSDTTWTNNISSSCSNYIQSGTGNLSILVSSQRSGLPNNCGIWTDYIEVIITHN